MHIPNWSTAVCSCFLVQNIQLHSNRWNINTSKDFGVNEHSRDACLLFYLPCPPVNMKKSSVAHSRLGSIFFVEP